MTPGEPPVELQASYMQVVITDFQISSDKIDIENTRYTVPTCSMSLARESSGQSVANPLEVHSVESRVRLDVKCS